MTDRVDLESKRDLVRAYGSDPKSLLDVNGNTVGSMAIADDSATTKPERGNPSSGSELIRVATTNRFWVTRSS